MGASALHRMLEAVGSLRSCPGCKHNFFLYAIHFAWVRFINKAAAAAFPGSAVIALAAFILMPVLMTAVSALIGGAMRRFVPNVYYMLSGGR